MSAPSPVAALFDVDPAWEQQGTALLCRTCGGALSVVHAHTYVVERQGWVKIGATNNLRRRLSELRRPAWRQHLVSPPGMDWTAPLTTLLTLDVDREHALHFRFRASHDVGEWFRPDAAMRSWLDAGDLAAVIDACLP